LKEVTDTFVRTSDHLRYLTTVDEEGDTQTIETTDSHPFWVVTDNPDLERAAGDFVVENGTILYHENLTVTEHGYYVEAKDLKIGDVFIGANGELTTLTGTERVEFPNGVTVYNFTVADNHNYYVIANLEAYENGASVVLVHNAGYHDHHIVMKSDHSKSWLPENSQYIKDTHKLLEDYKIDINDAANIVKHVPNKGHTIAYAKKVYEELSNVAENTIDLGKDVRQAIINKLKSIGREIIDQEYMK
ncbi:MAG: AHH domain-containing protein, partial [Planctomycetaceae bacterium]|nr:AHH domain-containing protein [Planctomycetaceae bacterium]